MKKILAFVFLFSLILPATFAQKYQKDSTGYRGVAVIDASIIGDGGKILVDNAYKQHTLYKKAKQWVSKNYQKIYYTTDGQERIVAECDDYSLSLRFSDGVFTFTFKDIVVKKDLWRTEQQVVDRLVQYVKTCKLEDITW